jgi:uncharacterized protein YjiS (DUF1127 family)
MRERHCCIAAMHIAVRHFHANINDVEDPSAPPSWPAAKRRTTTMMFSNLVKHAKSRIDQRIRYNRLVAEIESLTNRDLVDIGGDRGEMLRHAYRDVYGK